MTLFTNPLNNPWIVRNEETLKSILIWVLCISFVIYFGYAWYMRDQVRKVGRLGNCTVTRCDFAGRGHAGSIYISYCYVVNGQLFKNHALENELREGTCQNNLVGRDFPLLYLENNPEEALPLFTPRAFASVNRDYPDSLKWVVQLLIK